MESVRSTCSALRPERLRCEHLVDPIGLDEVAPRLSWSVAGDGRDRRQSAYEIRVATTREALSDEHGLAWHTGRVESDETLDHVYQGEPLQACTRYWWLVRVWDERGVVSGWADLAFFETGFMGAPWPAGWISERSLGADEEYETPRLAAYDNPFQALSVAHFRRSFVLDRPVASARLHATALGVYEMLINGRRVGEDVLAPGWTDYHTRLEYQTYDVSDHLVAGDNVVAALLGEGWYSGYLGFNRKRPANIYGVKPALSAFLVITFVDGTRLAISTDDAWRYSRGPHIYSDLLMGEHYDARLRMPGWDRPGFDDRTWQEPELGATPPRSIHGARGPAIRVMRRLAAKSVKAASDGSFVFDLGQNMVGRTCLRIRAERGRVIRLRHGEVLHEDGTLYVENLRSTRQEDIYVATGEGEEVWEPTFSVHGFRYVAVHGLAEAPPLEAIEGCVIHNAMEETSSLETSSDLVNRLYANILWGQRGNFLAVPTDCPQRDERLGWLADSQVFLRTASWNMDVQAFFTKWMIDVLDAQSPEGAFPDVAPRGPLPQDGAPAWGDAGVIVPMTLYERYGDERLLARAYPGMAAWLHYIRRHNPDGIRTEACHANFGDWLSLGEQTPKALVATAYYAHVAALMARAATILEIPEDAAFYDALFARIREAFQRRFMAEDGRLEGNTQTAYLLALAFDLMPDHLVPRAVAHLVENIEGRGGHLTTGFLGVRHLCPILTQHGHSDLAYRLALNESYPSWGYSIANGATTIWERWDGWTGEKGFQSPKMNSFNHYSLGSVGEWLFGAMAGIDDDRSGGAFRKIRLRPTPGPGVDRCAARFLSPRGWIASEWVRSQDGISYAFEVPANTLAIVELVAKGNKKKKQECKQTHTSRTPTPSKTR